MNLTALPSCHPRQIKPADRDVYVQSYRRMEIFQDRFTDQFFIGDCHGEQFGSLALCEDEIDRRMDHRRDRPMPNERTASGFYGLVG